MNEFLALTLAIVKNWSIDRNPDKSKDKPTYKEPPLTYRRWSDAIKFAISKTVIENINDYYYFSYDVNTKITLHTVDLALQKKLNEGKSKAKGGEALIID